MSKASYVRFTPEEYQAVCRAAALLDLGSHPSGFGVALANALRGDHPRLADRVAALRRGQILVLLDHLQGEGCPQPGAPEGEEVCNLTEQEWQVVWQASQVVRLHDDPAPDFPDRLLREVAETAPRLAAKLVGFSQGQLATLFRRVKSGRRWCP